MAAKAQEKVDEKAQGETQEGETQEISEATQSAIQRTVNAAVAGKFARTIPVMLDDAIGKAMATHLEKLTAGTAKPEPGKEGAAPGDDRLKALEARLAEQQKKLEERDAMIAAKEAASRLSEDRQSVLSAFRSAGLDETRSKHALALIYTEEKRIGRSQDGNRLVFKVDKKDYVEELDLEEGIKNWLKTDEGKHFLPAKPAAGSGARPIQQGAQNGKGKGGISALEAKRALGMAILGIDPNKQDG